MKRMENVCEVISVIVGAIVAVAAGGIAVKKSMKKEKNIRQSQKGGDYSVQIQVGDSRHE